MASVRNMARFGSGWLWHQLKRLGAALKKKQAVSFEHHIIEIGDVPVHYEVGGAGDPILLVHGLSGSTRWWAKNIQPLAAHFRVYSIDLIGFGERRGNHPFVLDDASSTIVRWMDVLGIERTHLIGHSMGGFISADLAADHPHRVERLILVDAAGMPFDSNVLIHARGLARAARYLSPDFVPVLMRDAVRAGPRTMTSAIRQILRSNLRDKLARIATPTLVIWGEYDTVIPLEIGRKLAAALRDVRFVVLQGGGHNPMWDRANAFNQEVLAFLLDTEEVHEETGQPEEEERERKVIR